ncbi:MAG: polysaccharide biosynthesis tyrosine autokinase [Verrucomicrobiota bacterium]|jgi:capsular exopolysaccharide synthesis family protein
MDEIKTPSPSPADAQLHFLDYWRVIRIRKAIIITVFLITAIIATAVTFILPEAYSSICRIKVEQDVSNVPGLNSGTTETGGGFDPYFIQTTFEIMQSEVVLSNVIATLDLNEKWGKKFNNGETLKTSETMLILKNNMLLTPVRNTKLITITIYSDDPKEAAQIANAEAASYTQYRLRTREQLALTGLDALQEQYDQEAQEIGVAQSNVDELRKNLGIVDQPGSEQYTEPINEDAMRQLDTQRISCEREYSEASSQLNDLNAYSTKQLRDVLPSLYPDTQLQSLLDKLHESEQDFAVSTNDYSLTNVYVLRIQSAIDTLNQQVDNRVVGLMAGIKSRVDAAKAALDDITRQVDEAKTTTLADSTKNQPYYDAKRNLQQLTELHRLLYLKMDSERVDAKIPQDSMVSVVDPAEPGKSPVKPNKPVNIALGLIFGLIMGVGLAFFIEYLDTSVKTIDDVERIFQAPVLGVIPQNIGYLLEEGAESKNAEAYRVLRTNLLFSRRNEKFNTIVIVSAGAGEGKSTTTINLSTVFAQAGNRVLIVDSDLRRPTLHKLFKVPNNLGLTNYLLKQNSVLEVVQSTPVPNLDFMPSGKLPNSAMGILGSAQMKEMIGELKLRYDFIFFDSPPILGVSDASVLASEVDLVMQVIQYRRYPQPMTIRAKQMIEKVGGNFVGIVLNNINMSQDEGYYYYSGYYHDYYYSRNEDEQEAEVKAKAVGGDDTQRGIKQKY